MLKLKTFAGAMVLAPFLCGPGIAQTPPPAQQSLFPQGSCSGVLCGVIGGSQAPQKSLFRDGACGGVLCDAIGGTQAPGHAEPPPACGGGILCDMAPYSMGVPVTAGDAARAQVEHARMEAAAPSAPLPQTEAPHHASRRHHRAARKARASHADQATRTAPAN